MVVVIVTVIVVVVVKAVECSRVVWFYYLCFWLEVLAKHLCRAVGSPT